MAKVIDRSSRGLVYLLGYAGLIPFLALASLVWFDDYLPQFYLLQAFHLYSIMILVFLCGSWWGFAFAESVSSRWRGLMLSLSNGLFLLLLAGMWLLLMNNRWITGLLALGYIVFYAIEYISRSLPIGSDYRRMRLILTVIVVVCHISVILAQNQA